jgi:hypothetical protein
VHFEEDGKEIRKACMPNRRYEVLGMLAQDLDRDSKLHTEPKSGACHGEYLDISVGLGFGGSELSLWYLFWRCGCELEVN